METSEAKNGLPGGVVLERIRRAWCADTAYDGTFDGRNPSRGQCAVTALLLHELYGYEVWDVMVGRSRHFFNVASGTVIDLTAEQFHTTIRYSTGRKRKPDDLRKNKALTERLEILRERYMEHSSKNKSLEGNNECKRTCRPPEWQAVLRRDHD